MEDPIKEWRRLQRWKWLSGIRADCKSFTPSTFINEVIFWSVLLVATAGWAYIIVSLMLLTGFITKE